MLTRRSFFSSAAAGLGACATGSFLSTALMAIPAPAWASVSPSRDGSMLDTIVHRVTPRLAMHNKHTGETIDLVFFDHAHGYYADAIGKIDWIMRDWRQDEIKATDARLIWGLAALSDAARVDGHSGIVGLNSGYRTRKTNNSLEGAVWNSMHLKAKAADFTLDGVPTKTLAAYARWLNIGGVGHYPNSFVHIDAGKERSWTG